MKLLDEVAGLFDGVFADEAGADFGAAELHRAIAQDLVDDIRDAAGAIGPGLDPLAGAKPAHAVGVVELIVGEGHDDLGDSAGEGLGGGADAAVVHERGAAREKLAEWSVRDVDHVWRKVFRNVLAMAAEQDAAAAEILTGFDGFLEEVMLGPHSAAGGEGDGWIA